MKENYNHIEKVLILINYNQHQWPICVDFKMINFLLGQQSGYTKYPCFICLWDSSTKKEHYIRKNWPMRATLKVGEKNVIQPPLVPRDKIILLPLRIKLARMKRFVKALDKKGDCFKHVIEKFPNISYDKIKAGIFDGPQIRKLINDKEFTNTMNILEKNAWLSFIDLIKNFLGN